MSNSMHTARKLLPDRPGHPICRDRLYADYHTAGVLSIIDRYKSVDRRIKAGCDLFRMGERGEAIYSLVDGWTALYNLLDDGRRQILQFTLPGTVLAFLPARGGTM